MVRKRQHRSRHHPDAASQKCRSTTSDELSALTQAPTRARKRRWANAIAITAILSVASLVHLRGSDLRGRDDSDRDDGLQRRLSLDLGAGNCKWQPPQYAVPDDIDFHKTLIAGFPSGDKRMIFVQMEALTGWREYLDQPFAMHYTSRAFSNRICTSHAYHIHIAAAKDEWDFEYLGDSNHPFIKANYPHHEGIWGWSSNADQVVMMVRNIRRSMVECE